MAVKGVPPVGLEPTHLAPEASALSSELRGCNRTFNITRRICLYKFGHRLRMRIDRLFEVILGTCRLDCKGAKSHLTYQLQVNMIIPRWCRVE